MAQRLDPSDIANVRLVGSSLLAERVQVASIRLNSMRLLLCVFAFVVVSVAICNTCG